MDRRYRTVRASKTEGTSVPAIALHVIALELEYLQIIVKMAHRDYPLHCISNYVALTRVMWMVVTQQTRQMILVVVEVEIRKQIMLS
jgi:hypothetical protein